MPGDRSAVLTPVGPVETGSHDHVVQFYDDDAALLRGAGTFVVDGVVGGETTVVIATAGQRELFAGALAAAGVDVAAVLASGEYVVVDADIVLAELLRDDRWDARRFERMVTDLVEHATAAGRPVRVYGEMVALLWQRGHVTAAIEVEALWNEVGQEHEFALYCGYPTRAVAGARYAEPLGEVCHLHTVVLDVPPGWHGPVQAVQRFLPTADAPRAARRFVVQTLRAWRQPDLVDDAALAATELATNATLHAGSPFAISVTLQRTGVRLAARDRSPFPPTLRDAAPTASSGRGVAIVAAVAGEWGVELFADGKVVWAELRR